MPWIVNPRWEAMVDAIMVAMDMVAMDILAMEAVVLIMLLQSMELTFLIQTIHLQDKSGPLWVMDMNLFGSYMNAIRLGAGKVPLVVVEPDMAIMNAMLLLLKLMMQILQ